MPTPRYHGGAELLPIPLTLPGFKGLNKQNANALLGPEWATELQNVVFDESNRMRNRKGWDSLTTTPVGAEIVQVAEYVPAGGATGELIVSTDSDILRGDANGASSFTSVKGGLTITNGNWQFMNYNDRLIGVQDGQAPIVYNGGVFTSFTDINAPTGGVGLSAFGRLWIVDSDGTTLKYSGLFNHDDWSSSDSGSFNFLSVWPTSDRITALAAFNDALVIFGRRHISFYVDGQGSAFGVDPLQIYLAEQVAGVGCIARDSVQYVGNDLWFLSDEGINSVRRVVVQKSNPIENVSSNNGDFLRDRVALEDTTKIRSVYSPDDRFYLLSLPTAGICFCLDTRGRLDDGTARTSTWSGLVPSAITRRDDDSLAVALPTAPGELGTYRGYLDNGNPYSLVYESGWLDFGAPGYLKILKRINGIFFLDAATSVDVKWWFDFESTPYMRTFQLDVAGADPSEWGLFEWGTGEWGSDEGGLRLAKLTSNSQGTGQYMKVGITSQINNRQVAVQTLDLFAKIGRMAG